MDKSFYVQVKHGEQVVKAYGPFTFEEALDCEWACSHDPDEAQMPDLAIVEGSPGTLFVKEYK